jgi:hypothetical protein
MIPLKQFIENILSKAVCRAFPVNEKCEVDLVQSGCDYTSKIPKVIFDKYKTGLHTFGLFNEREIADCIFVNCEKTGIIKAVQVSGSGDLQIFINDSHIKESILSIITSGRVFLKEVPEVSPKLLCHLLFNHSEQNTLACKRAEFILGSLCKIHGQFGSKATILNLIFDENGLEERFQRVNDLTFEISLLKNSKFSDWISKFIVLYENEYPKHSLELFYKYFHHDKVFSKSISKYLAPYGEVFNDFQSSPKLYSTALKDLKSLDIPFPVQVLTYLMLKSKRISTILLKSSDLFSKAKDSIYAINTILSHLKKTEISTASLSELSSELRIVLLFTLTLPETLLSCISKSSLNDLILWSEHFSSLYISTSPTLDKASLSVLNQVSKVILEYILSLLSS